MNKISKNIKKLRSEKGYTQDTLAEKICVTRQAVSSWETGRTQPDAQMLISLSEVFGVPIEMLIYGEKRNTVLEEGNKTYMSTATVIIAVLGSLLVAGGVGLIFTALWQELPIILKAFFAFIPMLGGQAFAFYVIKKKRSSISFCEGSAVLWSAGVIITLALINSIFSIHIGYENCLLFDGLMIFPIMLILNAVSPLPLYFYMTLHWGIETASGYGSEKFVQTLLVYFAAVLMTAAGIAFSALRKKSVDDPRFILTQWVCVGAVIVLTYFTWGVFEFDLMFTLLSLAVIIFVLDKNNNLRSPFMVIGALSTLGVSILTYLMYAEDVSVSFYMDLPVRKFTGIALCSLAVAVSILKNKDRLIKNKLKLTEVLLFISVLLVEVLNFGFQQTGIASLSGILLTVSQYLILVLVFASGVVFIFEGAKENRLFLINAGFISDSALAFYLLYTRDTGLFIKGFALLIMGCVLLAVNLIVSKRKKEAELK